MAANADDAGPSQPNEGFGESHPGAAGARATDMATRAPARTVWDRRPSVAASRRRHFCSAFDRPPTSPSTLGRRTRVCGLKISSSPAKPAKRMMIISSSNTSPTVWGNSFGHGSNFYRLIAFTIGRSSRRSSLGTFRGHMSATGIPRTSRAGSPGNATLFQMTSMHTSSARSSLG